MPKYFANFTYSSGSWARLINSPEDRTAAAQNSEDGMAIADFPDSVSASAVEAAIFKTGAFGSVDGHELLTQQQIRDRLVLAKDASQAYEVPGRPD
jgi:hypothetical protein